MAKAPKTEALAAVTVPDQVEATAPNPDTGAIDTEATAAANVADAPRTLRARVLAYCNLGAPDDVIEVEADLVDGLGDVIDTDPAAVAYAESLKG